MELLKPAKIGKLSLANRLVMAPVKTGYATSSGEVTDELIDYYMHRARGGVGLITLESAYVDPSGKEIPRQLGLYDDALVPGFRRLIDALHQAGSKVSVFINHAGRVANPAVTKQPLLAPSPLSCPAIGVEPQAIPLAEIHRWQDAYVHAALRARRAGADALELQFGHGYLIHQFLSPHSNRREDHYGGSFENRVRFGMEILDRITEELGPDFPVIVRLSADEFLPDGWTLPEAIRLAKQLEASGVAAIDVSLGSMCESVPLVMQTLGTKKGQSWDLAAKIKEQIQIPVIAVGRINTPALAEEILSAQKADLVALGRPLVADPLFFQKAAAGRSKEIRPCAACHQGCFDELRAGRRFGCNFNPAVGKEDELELPKAPQAGRRVYVIGAGPAGLELAYTAAARGHQVTLYDEGDELGGQILSASVPPHKDELGGILAYYREVLPALGVTVHLHHRVTPEEVKGWDADAVVFATGGQPIVPPIPGLRERGFLTAVEVLRQKKAVGARVLILGGGLIGMETADYLSAQGKEVTVVELLDEVARDMGVLEKNLLLKRLKERGVQILVKTRLVAVGETLVVETPEGKKELPLPETIVLAVGVKADRSLYEKVSPALPAEKLYLVGDAKEARKILHAVAEGRQLGLTL